MLNLIAINEVSSQQAAARLTMKPSFLSSHKFAPVYIWEAMRQFEEKYPESEYPINYDIPEEPYEPYEYVESCNDSELEREAAWQLEFEALQDC